jgi:hypothetical protein
VHATAAASPKAAPGILMKSKEEPLSILPIWFWAVIGTVVLFASIHATPYGETPQGQARARELEHQKLEKRKQDILSGRITKYHIGYIGGHWAECIGGVVYIYKHGAHFLPGKTTPETCPWP